MSFAQIELDSGKIEDVIVSMDDQGDYIAEGGGAIGYGEDPNDALINLCYKIGGLVV